MDKILTKEMPETMYSELALWRTCTTLRARLVNIELIGTGKTRDLLWTFSLNGPFWHRHPLGQDIEIPHR